MVTMAMSGLIIHTYTLVIRSTLHLNMLAQMRSLSYERSLSLHHIGKIDLLIEVNQHIYCLDGFW